MNDERMILVSTHQVRDLDNLIDHVIIVDNGELLINASLPVITEKLCFKTFDDALPNTTILYEEESLKGKAVVIENTTHEDSKINLEHLFNAVTENTSQYTWDFGDGVTKVTTTDSVKYNYKLIAKNEILSLNDKKDIS